MATKKDQVREILSIKKAPKGTDILGTTDYTYIIRSDLDSYVMVDNLKMGTNSTGLLSKEGPKVLRLHPHCSGGDHYFAAHHSNTVNAVAATQTITAVGMWIASKLTDADVSVAYDRFYILKGNEFRTVKNLTTDEDPKTGVLHHKCRGGEFYMATSEYHANSTTPIFIVVRSWDGKFDAFKDLESGERSQNYKQLYKESHDGPYRLHSNCSRGLYYWATKSQTLGKMRYYILKGMDSFGAVTIHRTSNLRTDEGGEVLVLHISLTNFLPGGLSHNLRGQWNLLKAFSADKAQSKWRYQEVKKVGYNKEVLHTIQHHWDAELKYSFENEAKSGLLVEKVFSTSMKHQFSAAASYGGYVQDSIKDAKHEEKIDTIDFDGTLEPGGKVSIWQYVVVLSSENKVVFYSPSVARTDSDSPPDYEPQAQLKPEDMVK